MQWDAMRKSPGLRLPALVAAGDKDGLAAEDRRNDGLHAGVGGADRENRGGFLIGFEGPALVEPFEEEQ